MTATETQKLYLESRIEATKRQILASLHRSDEVIRSARRSLEKGAAPESACEEIARTGTYAAQLARALRELTDFLKLMES